MFTDIEGSVVPSGHGARSRMATRALARPAKSIEAKTPPFAEGIAGLDRIPRVGKGIASAIAEILVTGRWSQLDRLRGSSDPEALLQAVPGIGPELAEGQCTVVTQPRGPLAGRRVVRGREAQCRAFYLEGEVSGNSQAASAESAGV